MRQYYCLGAETSIVKCHYVIIVYMIHGVVLTMLYVCVTTGLNQNYSLFKYVIK